MKMILAPTDFSKASENAVNYAAEIAKLTKSKMILFHAFHVPVATDPEMALMMPNMDELEKAFMLDLKKIEKKLHLNFGDKLAVQCVVKCGFAVEEINNYASKHTVDLIVMGMQGAGYLAEKLMGSTTTSLIGKSKCPVLAIDKDVKYRSIKKIAFACDYMETGNKKILDPLKEFARLFKSHVYVLNVIKKPEPVPSTTGVVTDLMNLEQSLADIDHTFHHLQNEEIVEGINTFVKEGKMDMVVMIPRKHTLLSNIFSEPNTKKMAFHSKVPLLALH